MIPIVQQRTTNHPVLDSLIAIDLPVPSYILCRNSNPKFIEISTGSLLKSGKKFLRSSQVFLLISLHTFRRACVNPGIITFILIFVLYINLFV